MDSTKDTFARFLSEVRLSLQKNDTDGVDRAVFGCDDAKALVSAVRFCFPKSAVLASSVHLKRNKL